MFDKFYNLSAPPFMLTPDSRFFFGSSGHSRAMAHLVYGLSQQEGFIVITGDVGAGKTTLAAQLCSQLDRGAYAIALVATAQVSGDDLLRLAMAGFGLDDTPGTGKPALLRRFEHLVREERQQGRRCLLVIDEVQNLSPSALEELRILSNIVTDGRTAVQTILLGQPQFRSVLAGAGCEQLRQRVLACCHLGPLAADETRRYIEHRLRTAGWRDDPVLEDAAVAAVHRHTGGIPRRINTLCARVLLLGAIEETHSITAAMVEETAAELDRDLGVTGSTPPPDALDRLARRIDHLERWSCRQEQVFSRVLELLEANATGRV